MYQGRSASGTAAVRPTPARVFLVCNDEKTAGTIAAAVRAKGYEAVQFDSAEAFLAADTTDGASCVIAEADLPGITGLDLHERISLRTDHTPVIIIDADAEIAVATAAIRSGVIDYLNKPFRTSTLLDRIAEAISLSREAIERSTQAMRLNTLTRREAEILGYLTEGYPVSEIARTLSLSPKTVQAHRSNIMEKTETLSVVELTRLCVYARPDLIGIGPADPITRPRTPRKNPQSLVAQSQRELRLVIDETSPKTTGSAETSQVIG